MRNILSYGLPAILAVGFAADGGWRAAAMVRRRRPDRGARSGLPACDAGNAAFFETDLIGWRNPASEAENYAYSAVWLALGIVLLAFGLWRASREVRLASGLFVVAAILKVFLYDLAQLEGILRALSFIGLGAVLISIGLVYQKLIFPRSSQT